MGVNVRVNFAGTALEDSAISLETALGRSLERAELLKLLLDRVDHWFEHLRSNEMLERWTNLLVTLGQRVKIGEIEGVAEGVDARGALLVRDEAGRLRPVIAGDLVMG
jgi:BirA family biotin operon repressor/biotin-[acetyl-CoA-carboxylase] ligase